MAGGLCRIVCVLLALCLPTLAQAGPQCYSCQHIKDPGMCDTKITCKDNEECFVEETASESREVVFNMGCEAQQVCGRLGGPGAVSRARRSIVTCFKCCNNNLCNAVNCRTLCSPDPCHNNATCVSDRTGALTECHCRPGFTGDLCETLINQCASAPCKNGGTCSAHINGFSCTCPPGYSGITCAAKTSPSTCFECNGVDDPNHCTRRVTCPRGETCFTDALVENGIMSFNQGCRPIEVCKYYEDLTGSRHQRSPHNLAVCSECCADDLCNGLRCLSAVHHFTSCKAYFEAGYKTSGSYQVYLNDCGEGFYVYCDMTGTGGPWTVIQRRKDGSVDFRQPWLQYAKGFGNLEREFWLGNDHIHCLTQSGFNELRIEMTDWHNAQHFIQYYPFSVGDSTTNYTLTVSNYTGDAGDSFLRANGQTFLTADASGAAAWGCNSSLTGGWWFPSNCDNMMSNLNGVYGKQGDHGREYVAWSSWKPDWDSLKFSEMKLK